MAKKNNNNSDWMSRKQDEQTEQLEERLTALYANAENEIRAKWDDFMSGFEKEDNARREAVEAGLMPEDEYTAWRKTQILKSNQYSKAVESMTNMLVETDVAAMATVNEELPQVVAESYDFVQGLGFQAAEEAGLTSGTFQIYNARTVQALIKDNPDLMPKPSVDIPEDQRWSKDRINREITQGIVQGESIPKIANRLSRVTTMDRNAAVRNARTAMTGAENLGRYQSAQDLRENGIPIEEVWMATPDDRTRESHRLLDGTTRDESGYFGVGIIDTPLRFAGDPLGAPEEVYNCRCRTGIVLQGIDHSQDGDLYAEFMRQFEDGKEMLDGKAPEAQSQHPEPEQKTAEEITANEENTVVALHITSEDNIEQILNNGFDLERAGTGAGSTWGDGAYFATGTDEKTFYQYRIGNENGVAAKIDTTDMLTVDLGTGPVKSPNQMYDMAAKQLTEDEYKEYKQHIKEQEATGSEAKRLAFEETVKDHYTGLVIQQESPNGLDPLSGGNQIVVYDTRAIEVLDKASVTDDLEQIATSRSEETTPAMISPMEYAPADKETMEETAAEWELGLSDSQKEAIKGYTNEGYGIINGYLRTEDEARKDRLITLYTDLPDNINNIDEAIKGYELQENITVYRQAESDIVGGLEVGDKFHDSGYASTTITESVTDDIDGDVFMEIDIPAGEGRGAYIDALSAYGGEDEFLLARGSDFEVIEKRELDDGMKYLHVRWTGTTLDETTEKTAAEAIKEKEEKQERKEVQKEYTYAGHKENDDTQYTMANHLTDEGEEQIAKDLDVSIEEARDMGNAICDYSGYDFQYIRCASQGDIEGMHRLEEENEDWIDVDELIKKAEDIEKFIDLSPKWEGGAIERGIHFKDGSTFDTLIQQAERGDAIDMKGMTSWTSNADVALNFAETWNQKSNSVILKTNDDRTELGTSIRHISRSRDEDEVLVSKEAEFIPTRIERQENIVYIYGDLRRKT